MILRHKKDKDYTMIDNRFLEDDRLSWRAKGLGCYLFSKPDGWNIKTEHLVRCGIEGRDAVAKAMKELENAGYLVRFKYQDEKGRWYTEVSLHEIPQTHTPEPLTEKPMPGLQGFGNPIPGKQGRIVKTDVVKTDVVKTEDSSSRNGYATATPSLPDGKGLFCSQPIQASFVQASSDKEEPAPDDTATLPRDYAKKPPTEQQQYFEAVCVCVGWDSKTLTREQCGQVAQVVGVLRKAGYSVGTLKIFQGNWFRDDWRGKKGQFPTLSQLRAEIGKTKSVIPTSISSSPLFKIKDLS